jgi:hypothetical protein
VFGERLRGFNQNSDLAGKKGHGVPVRLRSRTVNADGSAIALTVGAALLCICMSRQTWSAGPEFVEHTFRARKGSLTFVLIERFRARSRIIEEWEIRSGRCGTCGREGRVARVVVALGFDNPATGTSDVHCEDCIQARIVELKSWGVVLRGTQALCAALREFDDGP